jgi:hypothetical protein
MNIQAMRRAYINHNNYDPERHQRDDLKSIIDSRTRDFWIDESNKLLEKQKGYSPDNEISVKDEVIKLRKGIRKFAHDNNIDCSFVSEKEFYYFSLRVFRIHFDTIRIQLNKETGTFSIKAPYIMKKNFLYNEWQMGMKWIKDYLDIDVKGFREKIQNLEDDIYVSSKTSKIAESSINSLCKAYTKQDDLKFRVLSSPLRSEVVFYKIDDYPLNEPGAESIYSCPFYSDRIRSFKNPNEHEIRIFRIFVYHKAFINNPAILIDLLKDPHNTDIENVVKCTIFQTMTKTPREILIGSDSDNMCLTCAVGILNNPSEEFKSRFEDNCKSGGLAFEQISTCNNNILYFFMNTALDDAKKFFESYKLKVCIYIQKQYSMTKNACFLHFELLQWNAKENNLVCVAEQCQREDVSTALQSFLNLYNPDFDIKCSFQEISMRFFQKYSWKTPSRLNEEAYVYLENAHKYCGSARMRYRCRMYHKPQGWELEDGLRNQYYEMWKNGI